MYALLLATVIWNPMTVHRWVDRVVECKDQHCSVVLDDSTQAVVYHPVKGGEYVTCRVKLSDESVHCDIRE